MPNDLIDTSRLTLPIHDLIERSPTPHSITNRRLDLSKKKHRKSVSLIVARKGVEVPALSVTLCTRPPLTSFKTVRTGPPHLSRPSLSESQSANARTLTTGAQSTPSPSAMAAVLSRCALEVLSHLRPNR
jgi:hypothetical protein